MKVSIIRGGRRGIDLEIVSLRFIATDSSSPCSLRYPYAGARLQRCSERRGSSQTMEIEMRQGMRRSKPAV